MEGPEVLQVLLDNQPIARHLAVGRDTGLGCCYGCEHVELYAVERRTTVSEDERGSRYKISRIANLGIVDSDSILAKRLTVSSESITWVYQQADASSYAPFSWHNSALVLSI